jgi:hypothetical protein
MTMTLDEAIEHAEEKARQHGGSECGGENHQLSEWLKELRKRRQADKDKSTMEHCADCHGLGSIPADCPVNNARMEALDKRRELEREIVDLMGEVEGWKKRWEKLKHEEFDVVQQEVYNLRAYRERLLRVLWHEGKNPPEKIEPGEADKAAEDIKVLKRLERVCWDVVHTVLGSPPVINTDEEVELRDRPLFEYVKELPKQVAYWKRHYEAVCNVRDGVPAPDGSLTAVYIKPDRTVLGAPEEWLRRWMLAISDEPTRRNVLEALDGVIAAREEQAKRFMDRHGKAYAELAETRAKLARCEELKESAMAISRRLQDEARKKGLPTHFADLLEHHGDVAIDLEKELMHAISNEVAKDWADIEDGFVKEAPMFKIGDRVKSGSPSGPAGAGIIIAMEFREGQMAAMGKHWFVKLLLETGEETPWFPSVVIVRDDSEPAGAQIKRLADFIMAEIDGEPRGWPVSRSGEGAVDCAIRVLGQFQEERNRPPLPLVGNVTDVEKEIEALQEGGFEGMDRLVSLFRRVVDERDRSLYWENHFRSALRHVETQLKTVRAATTEAIGNVAHALDGDGGTGVGNFVNIPKKDQPISDAILRAVSPDDSQMAVPLDPVRCLGCDGWSTTYTRLKGGGILCDGCAERLSQAKELLFEPPRLIRATTECLDCGHVNSFPAQEGVELVWCCEKCGHRHKSRFRDRPGGKARWSTTSPADGS